MKKFLLFITSQRITNFTLAFIAVLTTLTVFKVGYRSNLEAKFSNLLVIDQYMGEFHFYQYINVKNVGKKLGYLTKIKGYIRSKESDKLFFEKKVEGRNFVDENTLDLKPFLEFPLGVDDNFYSEVELSGSVGRFDQDSIAIFHNRLANEAKGVNMSILNFGERNASDNLSLSINNFILKRIKDLKQGEYEYIIALYDDRDDSIPFAYKCYSFTLYESNIEVIKESMKFQQTIIRSPLNNTSRGLIKIQLTEILTSEGKNSLLKKLEN